MMNKIYFIILILLSFAAQNFYSQNGIAKSYYPDGNLYSEISYVNDVLDGTAYWYYPNGNLKMMKEFSKGKLNGYVREYYESGLLKEEYSVKDGIKNGTHRIYYDNGALKEIMIYEYGKLIQSKQFDYDPTFIAPPNLYLAGNRQQGMFQSNSDETTTQKKKKQELICDVDICPVPIGGMKTIQDNLIYPEHALLYGLEGNVILIASIDEKGDVTNTEVIKSLGLGCDEAAEEAVKRTKFIPGQKDGKVTSSRVTLKIEFKIFDLSNKVDTSSRFNKSLIAKSSSENSHVNNTQIQSKAVNDIKVLEQTKNILKQKTEITCNYEECPYPVGGLRSINDHLEIPAIAKRLKLNGNIIIEAYIDKYGIVRDTKVIQGIGYGCDDAVESAILQTKFNPARSNGKEVDSKTIIIFPFDYNE